MAEKTWDAPLRGEAMMEKRGDLRIGGDKPFLSISPSLICNIFQRNEHQLLDD
jgi:hypothetical protein